MTTNSRRTSLVIRLVALATILFAPILAAKRQLLRASGEQATASAAVVRDDSAAIARYFAARNPLVDSLLPEGSGGTLFRPDLDDGKAGVAIAATATIMLAIHGLDSEATELHERAHLLHAYHPTEVDRLLARLPHPAPAQYAAKNSREHFAEMAAAAWQLVHPRADVCYADTPSALLHAAERDVPGTAGFVIRFIRAPVSEEQEDTRQLLAAAVELSAPLTAEWSAIWSAVERRRLRDGSLVAWQAPTVAGMLDMWRTDEWHSGGWLGRVTAVLLLPSATLAEIF